METNFCPVEYQAYNLDFNTREIQGEMIIQKVQEFARRFMIGWTVPYGFRAESSFDLYHSIMSFSLVHHVSVLICK